MTVMNIVIAVVLLAIIAILIICFRIWNRENKRRTDSIWAIADSLDRVERRQEQMHSKLSSEGMGSGVKPAAVVEPEPKVSVEPVSQQEAMVKQEPDIELGTPSTDTFGEISFDFYVDKNDTNDNNGEIDDDEIIIEEFKPDRNTLGKDIGKSGKKYTAEELEMLIKE